MTHRQELWRCTLQLARGSLEEGAGHLAAWIGRQDIPPQIGSEPLTLSEGRQMFETLIASHFGSLHLRVGLAFWLLQVRERHELRQGQCRLGVGVGLKKGMCEKHDIVSIIYIYIYTPHIYQDS